MSCRRAFAAVLVPVLGLATGAFLALAAPARADGSVAFAVADAATGASDVQAEPGSVVVMRVSVQGAESLSGADFTLRYDSSVVRVADEGVTFDALPGGFISIAEIRNEQGSTVVGIARPEPVGVESFTVADVEFEVVGALGSATTLSLEDVLAAASSEESLDVTTSSATIGVVSSQGPVPTPRPTVGRTSTRTPSPKPTPTAGPTGTPTSGPEATAAPEGTPTHTPAPPTPTPTTAAPGTPTPGAEATPGGAIVAIASPSPDQATAVQPPIALAPDATAGSEPAPVTEDEGDSGSGCSLPWTAPGRHPTGAADLGLLGVLLGGLAIVTRRRR